MQLERIKENENAQPLPTLNIGKRTGFPCPQKRDISKRNGEAISRHVTQSSEQNIASFGHQFPGNDVNLLGASHFQDEIDECSNAQRVRNMSADDATEAMQEIKSLISVKNLQRMRMNSNQCSSAEKNAPVAHEINLPSYNFPHSLTEHNRNILERFDLEGRKIIQQRECVESICNVLHDHMQNEVHFRQECLQDAIHAFAVNMLNRAMREEGLLCISHSRIAELSGNQPQSGLHHHYNDPNAPGYTLQELCEMCRSQFPNHRLVAARLLTLIMQRRSAVVSVEAYSAQDMYFFCPTVDQHRYGFLHDLFLRSLNELRVIAVEYHLWANKYVESVLRSIIVACMLKLCAIDYPVELPTALLLNVNTVCNDKASSIFDESISKADGLYLGKVTSTAPTIMLYTLRAILIYLQGDGIEKCVAHQLEAYGLWGSTGCLQQASPHIKRSAVETYEMHIRKRRQNSQKIRDDFDIDGGTGGDIDPKDIFALRCRWSAVDAFIADTNILISLRGNIITSMNYILDLQKSISIRFSNQHSNQSAAADIVLSIGAMSLEILAALQRECFMQSSREALLHDFKENLWPACHWLMSASYFHCFFANRNNEKNDRTYSMVAGLIRSWWQYVAEAILKESDLSHFVFAINEEFSFPVLMLHLNREPDEYFTPCDEFERAGTISCTIISNDAKLIRESAVRMIRSSLVYGHGFNLIATWLLGTYTVATERISNSAISVVSSFDHYWILEQALVSLSARLLLVVNNNPATCAEEIIDSSLFTAIEAASALLIYMKDHVLCEASRLLYSYASSLGKLSRRDNMHVSSVLSCLCTLLQTHHTNEKECKADTIFLGHLSNLGNVRGSGLLLACSNFAKWFSSVDLLAEQSQSCTLLITRLRSSHDQLIDQWAKIFNKFCEENEVLEHIFGLNKISGHAFQCSTCCDWSRDEASLAVVRTVSASFATISHYERISSIGRQSSLYKTFKLNEEATIFGRISQWLSNCPVVADGLIAWHRYRISHALWLCCISFLAQTILAHYQSEDHPFDALKVVEVILESAEHFRVNSFVFPLLRIVSCAIERLIVNVYSFQENECTTSELADAIASAVIFEIKGCRRKLLSSDYQLMLHQRMTSFERLFCILNGTSNSFLIRSASMDWMDILIEENEFVDFKLSLHRRCKNRLFDVLLHLEGSGFNCWMRALHILNRSKAGCQFQANASKVQKMYSSAGQIFRLLTLTVCDQAHRWIDASIMQSTVNHGAMENNLDPSVETVEAFSSLLLETTNATAGHSEYAWANNEIVFNEVMADIAADDFFSASAYIKNCNLKNRRHAPLSKVRHEGIFDLCDKVCEAALCQAVGDVKVHAVSLLVLSCCPTVVPWTVRQRVWKCIGPPNNLIHLMEDADTIERLLPSLLKTHVHSGNVKVQITVSLYEVIIEAILNMRDAQNDSTFSVTALAIFQLSQFFNALAEEGAIARPLIERLLKLFGTRSASINGTTVSNWLLCALLRMMKIETNIVEAFLTGTMEAAELLNTLRHCCRWSAGGDAFGAEESISSLSTKFVQTIFGDHSMP